MFNSFQFALRPLQAAREVAKRCGCNKNTQISICRSFSSRTRVRVRVRVPASTWSLQDLNLSQDPDPSCTQKGTDQDAHTNLNTNANVATDPASVNAHMNVNVNGMIRDEELNTLAQRCLLDVQTLSHEDRHDLKVELSKMMRCISLIGDVSSSSSFGNNSAEEMYDIPRGFDSNRPTPVRSEAEELGAWNGRRNGTSVSGSDGCGGKKEAEQLMKKLGQRHKTIQVKNDAGEEDTFFSVVSRDNSSA